jgi:hypothetical protein
MATALLASVSSAGSARKMANSIDLTAEEDPEMGAKTAKEKRLTTKLDAKHLIGAGSSSSASASATTPAPTPAGRAPAKRTIVPVTLSTGSASSSSASGSASASATWAATVPKPKLVAPSLAVAAVAVDGKADKAPSVDPAPRQTPNKSIIAEYAKHRVINANQQLCRLVLGARESHTQSQKQIRALAAGNANRNALSIGIITESPILRLSALADSARDAAKSLAALLGYSADCEKVVDAYAALVHERREFKKLLDKDTDAETLKLMEDTFEMSEPESQKVEQLLDSSSYSQDKGEKIDSFFLGLPVIPGLNDQGMPEALQPDDLDGYAIGAKAFAAKAVAAPKKRKSEKGDKPDTKRAKHGPEQPVSASASSSASSSSASAQA